MTDCKNCIHYEIIKTESSSFCLCSKAFEVKERRRHDKNFECPQFKNKENYFPTQISYRPIPYALSRYGSGTEVLYKCSECGTDFRILGRQEKSCHGCGAKQDWSNSPQYCSEEFKKAYDELVYRKHAWLNGKEKIDEELRELLFSLYEGILV